MKRGFLLPKGVSAISKPEVNPSPTNDTPCDVIIHSVAYELLDPRNNSYGYKVRVDPSTFNHTFLPSDKTLCTRIPPSPIDSYGSAECLLATETMRRLYATPNYPCPPPTPTLPKVYEIRHSDSSKLGRGMFALQSFKVGDLILVERPLFVFCSNPVAVSGISWFDEPEMQVPGRFEWKSMEVFQVILQVLFDRMSKADQAAFLALPNAHKDLPPLIGIWKTNHVLMSKLNLETHGYTYTALFREMHRINHSCEPNSAHSFDPASFTVQIRATKPISVGEEITIPFCEPTLSTPQRRQWLSALGVTCTCPSCVDNLSIPRNDAIRTSIPERLKELFELRVAAEPSHSLMYASTFSKLSPEQSEQLQKHHTLALELKEKASKLMDDMVAVGVDGYQYYFEAVEAHCHATVQLSCTSDDQSLLKAQWNSEIKSLATETVILHNAHYGTFGPKHQFEVLFRPHGMLNLPDSE